jgi:hypothetical protein
MGSNTVLTTNFPFILIAFPSPRKSSIIILSLASTCEGVINLIDELRFQIQVKKYELNINEEISKTKVNTGRNSGDSRYLKAFPYTQTFSVLKLFSAFHPICR